MASKTLGTQCGVTITRPFSREMYEHNHIVGGQMKKNITRAVNNRRYTISQLNDITRSITGYTFGAGYSREDMRSEMLRAIDQLQDWWLHQEYSTLVNSGYCKKLASCMVGLDKKDTDANAYTDTKDVWFKVINNTKL